MVGVRVAAVQTKNPANYLPPSGIVGKKSNVFKKAHPYRCAFALRLREYCREKGQNCGVSRLVGSLRAGNFVKVLTR